MACNSIVALPRVCSDGNIGGLEKAYLIAFKDLKAITSATTEVYSASTNGTVVTVGLQSGKTFVEVGLLKSTSGLAEKATIDPTKDQAFFTQTYTLALGGLSVENSTFINSIKNQPVALIIKTRTGKYLVCGLNGQFNAINVEGGTGTVEGDMVGYTITMEGFSSSVAPFLDPTILSGLIAA